MLPNENGMPIEAARWILAERFRWTLDQVDALSIADLQILNAVDEGRNKARGIGVEVHGKKSSKSLR